MVWREPFGARKARAAWIAGSFGAVCAGVLAFVLFTSGGGAGARSLTVNLPPVASDTIYSAPVARGRPIVVIDPGHGGRDPGAIGAVEHQSEKDLTLAIALELRDRLVKDGRVRVAMTRADDRYLGLDDRAAVARRLNAASFISLHIDSAPNPLARGASVYSLSDVASDSEAASLAATLNRGSTRKIHGTSVEAVLADLGMRAQMRASAGLATRLVGKSAGRIELRPEPHRFAAFHVLRRSGSPAVLFEAGYLSNVDDETLIASPHYRSQVVRALADAIEADIAVRTRG
jgi:N-acetylmuramoyl-L-alanine amidase